MDSVVLETNMGDIQLELYWDHAPKVSLHGLPNTNIPKHWTSCARVPQTCKNFAELAKKGYYNGVLFHRIIAVRRSCGRVLTVF